MEYRYNQPFVNDSKNKNIKKVIPIQPATPEPYGGTIIRVFTAAFYRCFPQRGSHAQPEHSFPITYIPLNKAQRVAKSRTLVKGGLNVILRRHSATGERAMTPPPIFVWVGPDPTIFLVSLARKL